MYTLLDSGDFRKLEQIGPYRLVRPSPQAVWRPRLGAKAWQDVNATYVRSAGGDGSWTLHSKLPDSWTITIDEQSFLIELTDFGHLGIFAEQRQNWQKLTRLARDKSKQGPCRVLNLFGYTGGATLAAAAGGAEVVHVDASKTSNAWARENAALRGLADRPIRWITEDVKKFVEREGRRGSTYHGIILDPPSFGRGAKNEVWKIESDLPPLLASLKDLLVQDFSFILLSAHSNGYTPIALKNMVHDMVAGTPGTFTAEEMTVPEAGGDRLLPSGASCLFERQS